MTRKTIPIYGKKYIYLVCTENKNKNGCKNNKSIPLEKLEKIVLEVIHLYISQDLFFKLERRLLLKVLEEIQIYDKDRIEISFKFSEAFV